MSFGSAPRRGSLLPLLPSGTLDHWVCIVSSSSCVTLNTHYTSRTLVCPGEPECGLCDLGKPTTWYAYLAIEREGKAYLLRLTAPALGRNKLSQFAPGQQLILHRASKRRPLRIEFGGHVQPRRQISYLELLHVVSKIHLLPSVRMDESAAANEARLRKAAIVNCRILLEA